MRIMRAWQTSFLALAAVWGCSFWWMKLGLEALSPLGVAFGRLLLGALALSITLLVSKAGLPRGRRTWGHLAVDLHGIFLRAARRLGVELVTDMPCVAYENGESGATALFADGTRDDAELVIAADGIHSVARNTFVADEPVSSSYVAYRAAVPFADVRDHGVHEEDVVVYVGPRCHFVQYPLRGGEMFNQVAVFQSPTAVAGEQEWGTPDELDQAFVGMCDQVQRGLPLMWRDRWWRMFDREPVMRWVYGRVALLGDAAHPPLQYMAQGAVMAIEDGWVLAEHVGSQGAQRSADGSGIDWDAALAAYDAVRPEHCRRVLTTARAWGELWHLDGTERLQRNALLRARDTDDYSFMEWIYGPTALTPDQEPALYEKVRLDSVVLDETPSQTSRAV